MLERIKKIYREYESVQESAHGNNNSMKFIAPKAYTAKNDIKKRWYVYYSIFNPETGQMERQPNLSMGVNRYKTVKERLKRIGLLRKAIHEALKEGHSPFEAPPEPKIEPKGISAKEAINEVLELKKIVVKESTYSDYRIRTTQFLDFLKKEKLLDEEVTKVSRKIVNRYLDKVLVKSGARNRNNTKTVLSAIFTSLESKGHIEFNFVKTIENLKNNSKRDRTINTEDLETIIEHLKKEDPLLLFYLQFISFFFLRPIEVNRLKVENINLRDKLITVQTKQKVSKTKIIPELIYDELVDYLSRIRNTEAFLFTPDGPGEWDAKETNRRDHFSKRFKKVKNALNLKDGYSLYSFRHTYITKVYKELRKENSIDDTVAKLKLITGHTSDAIQRYIHLIDAELPEDYSHLLK